MSFLRMYAVCVVHILLDNVCGTHFFGINIKKYPVFAMCYLVCCKYYKIKYILNITVFVINDLTNI